MGIAIFIWPGSDEQVVGSACNAGWLHIDTAKVAASQLEYLWIHHLAPQEWNVGQQEHTEIATG